MTRNLLGFLLLTFVLLGVSSDVFGQMIRRQTDPAFDNYISQENLDNAVHSGDPNHMIDAAMQLAEGERILHRPHSGISAEDMMVSAARIAARKGDNASIDRLKTAAERIGRSSMIRDIDRVVEQTQPIQLPDTPDMEYANKQEESLGRGLMSSVNHAVIMNDHQRVNDTDEAFREVGVELSQKVNDGLRKFIDNAKASLTKKDYRDPIDDYRNSSRGGLDNRESYRQPYNDSDPGMGRFHQTKMTINDPNSGYHQPVYESRRLQAQFTMDPQGARITYIHRWSPLKDRLEIGDTITYLDGLPVNSTRELENHTALSTVDYISFRHRQHHRVKIYIR